MAFQKTILDESLSLYLHALVNDLKHTTMPTLFPPKDLQLEEFNNLVRLVDTVLEAAYTRCNPLYNRLYNRLHRVNTRAAGYTTPVDSFKTFFYSAVIDHLHSPKW